MVISFAAFQAASNGRTAGKRTQAPSMTVSISWSTFSTCSKSDWLGTLKRAPRDVSQALFEYESLFADLERDNRVVTRTTSMFSDVQRAAHFQSIAHFAHQNDRVGVGQ